MHSAAEISLRLLSNFFAPAASQPCGYAALRPVHQHWHSRRIGNGSIRCGRLRSDGQLTDTATKTARTATTNGQGDTFSST